jgi:hypothetical protein
MNSDPQNMKPLYEEHNRPIRNLLRIAGFILLPLGAIFMAVGLVDFFVSVSRNQEPTLFWCLFVGMPMLVGGVMCLKIGFMRNIGKYIAGESVPVATKSVQYVAQELRPTFRNYVQDLQTAGGADSADPAQRLRRLDELQKSGLISDSEYQTKRAEILQAL